ncbi:MAG: family efflux transporter, subunit [Gemmataceae bacterium]|nr:family efflux transporter, subunit [Gemmataceae bacterium]
MNSRWRSALLCFSLSWTGVLIGCSHRPSQLAPPEPPAVPVSQPVSRVITDYVDFTGRTDAIQAVDIRARVTGYLVEMPFKEGAEVKKGDLLFVIDPRPYQAQLDQAEGQVNRYQAQLELAQTTYARFQSLAAAESGAVSKQALDQYKAQVVEADATLKGAKASLEVYKLNLSFCKVTSPVDGQVSRYYLTLGNLVSQDQTLLTTVVSLDPVYAYFDVDEPTLLSIQQDADVEKIKQPQDGVIPVLMGLQGEDGFPHRGEINFVNNQVNPTTDSISFRGVFRNAKSPKGTRLLKPGMFVRIRLPMGQPHPALLVIDRAIASDQGLKYVYVLDAENKAQYRRVTTGALQEDGLRVVQGLQPDDQVVVGALQQVRPHIQIRPDKIPMPALGPNSDKGTAKQPDKKGGEQGDRQGSTAR